MADNENYQIKIHEKLYVGFRRGGGSSMPVGQITTVDHTKAYEKRKANIDYWASHGNGDKKPFDGVILDNKPMIGFRISRAQRNTGWHISTDFIRVEDPRGFEIDITLANMLMLTDNNLIENGELLRECIWGKDGNTNVLLPVNSVPYQQAFTNTERQKTHVDVRKLQLGDHVVLKNGVSGRYLGKLHALVETHYGNRYSYNGEGVRYDFSTTSEKPLHYVQVKIETQPGMASQYKYMGFASPNVSRVEKNEALTKEEINQLLIDEFNTGMKQEGSKKKAFMLFTDAPEIVGELVDVALTDIIMHAPLGHRRSQYGLTNKFFVRPKYDAVFDLAVMNYTSFVNQTNIPVTTTYQTAEFLTENKMSVKLSGEYKAASGAVADFDPMQLQMTIKIPSTEQIFTIRM